MKPLILNADYIIQESEIPDLSEFYEIHFTRFGKNERPGGEVKFYSDAAKKIFVHCNEPSTSNWVETADHVIKNKDYYTAIITSSPRVLESCSNAYKMPYGTIWLNKSPHHPDAPGKYTEELGKLVKNNSISMVCGNLEGKPGYTVRHTIWSLKDKIQGKLNFFSSTRFPLMKYGVLAQNQLPNDDKIHLFDSMYSVVVESSEEPNYFTEKLIDCLITKTIPIYWGCPNISEYFDTSYWIKAENIIVTKYTEEYYQENLDKINKNFEEAKKYCENIIERILNVIK